MTRKITRTRITLIFALLLGTLYTQAQTIDYPKASLTLNISQSSGTNGSGITFDAKKGLYYVVIAGNSVFPMEVFSMNGTNVFKTEAGNDMRGIWWNKKSKSIEGNCYADGGIVGMKLDESGYPSLGNTSIFGGGSHQPRSNVCGVFDGKKNIYYWNGEQVFVYSRKTGDQTSTINVKLTSDKMRNVNYTSMIYTGKKKMEIGLLDYVNKKVYLFNKKDGSLTATINLPESATTHESFRFGFANKYVFIYGTGDRSWVGYRIFE